MSTHRIMKWILLLCVITLIMNGFLYLGLRKPELLYSLVSAAGLGLISGAAVLLTKKKE
ncbi:LPXTG cell wall anchor domain-containing protein [Paenibacillus ihumii]|uniref:LPXTG cell wall anchor domain-containing protein n=1 Tax=Paenibacillus ihumii TaxID=687436 RepID=UPI000AEFECB0|nr:LPXTG cell wall anchor domain-containing protein [Paenibacillus ihumii]